MNSFIQKFAISVALIALSSAPVLAQDNQNNNEPSHSPKPRPVVDTACMVKAVDTRDTAIISAFGSYSTSVQSALMARKDGLKAAWALSDTKARREALRKVWNDYRTSFRLARRTLRDARNVAWSQYKTDAKTCNGNGERDSSDNQGQDSQL